MKKFLVLGVLFLLPIVAYLFFSSGVNHFAKLPVLTSNVQDIKSLENSSDSIVTLENKITILGFFGSDPADLKGNTFNLDQKILQKFYGFKDFQFVIVLPHEAKPEVDQFVQEFNAITEAENWKFVYGSPQQVQEIFSSLKITHKLDKNLQSPYVFIIDKDKSLRGRDDDEDFGTLYGYDSRSVSELANKMDDDVKVILAEYRLALKKYTKNKKDSNEG